MRPVNQIIRAMSVSTSSILSGLGPILGGLAGVALLATPAAADVKPVPPYMVVVQSDKVPMKCFDGGPYYAVRVMKAGTVLRVDGEGPGWLRAEYLPGMRAFAKGEEVSTSDGGKTVKLTRPSRLMAANETAGERANWWYLLDQDLPAGTTLTVSESLKSPDGKVYGYLVNAPAQARGYIKAESVRRATDAEAATYKGANPGDATAAKPTPTPPAPVQPEKPAPTVPQPVVVAPDSTQPIPGQPPEDAAVVVVPPAPAAVIVKPKPYDLDTLKEIFAKAMAPKSNDGELETVVAEFNRRIGTLGKSEEEIRVRTALMQRLEALNLRIEIRESMKQARQGLADLDEQSRRVIDAVSAAERQGVYAIVGKMVPSTVYDGKRGLPLMYRIESADASHTRTLGYVIPNRETDLLTKLGKVVGIAGEARFDEALKMNIVMARRVDVLTMAGNTITNAPSDSPSNPAAAVPVPHAPTTDATPSPDDENQ